MDLNATEIDEIFCAAIELSSPDERAEFIRRACGDHAELRERVAELLAAHFAVGEFLDHPPSAVLLANGEPLQEGPGARIGPYKLLQQIGEGGMGVVFMAEQSRPIQRIVAVKVIKPGMDTRQVIARFEAERQALAMMDHPNIARVLDAGTTETGRPYFVMDLVKGVPITEYCDEQRLSVRQRLELMTHVCHAIQHAHQKGIIHRDLKPSNVLVAEYDGQPVPKIIDFGVAKATAQKLTERTMFTQFGQIVGTFEYMSPEQARFNQLDVDTRSDIYSLGALLYELLTGSTPLEKERVRGAAFDEILRIISDDEPPRPSIRLSSSQILAQIAGNRHIEAKNLSGLVRGELDWIVMKCLEKDRNRRFETASGLADDLHRYLNDEPVVACPPSTRYRVKKFVRRYRAVVLASAAIVVALTTASGLSTWLYFRERDARHDAEIATANEVQLRQQAEIASSIAQTGGILLSRGLKGAEEHLNTFRSQLQRMGPRNAASYYFWLSSLYGRRAHWHETAAAAGKALEMNPNDHNLYHYYLPALLRCGDFKTYHRIRLQLIRKFGDTSDPLIAEHVLKDCLLTPWPDAHPTQLENLGKTALEATDQTKVWSLLASALLEYRSANYRLAIEHAERAMADFYRSHECHQFGYMVTAMAHHRLGETDKARDVLAAGVEYTTRHLSKEDDLRYTDNWNDWIIAQLLLDEASALILGYPHGQADESPAVALLNQRDFAGAERAARESLERHGNHPESKRREVGWDLFYLGTALAKQNKRAEAEPHLWEALTIFTKEYGDVYYANGLAFPILRDVLVSNNDLPGMVRLWTEFPAAARLARFFNAGGIVGPFPADAARGKRVTFSAWIKTENVSNYAGLWWGATAADFSDLGAAVHTEFDAAKGTTDWKQYAVEMNVPAETEGIAFGLVMPGTGRVWIDAFEVRLDGELYESDQFDFDFESPELVGFAALHSKSYRTQIDLKVAKFGKQSVRIDSVEPPVQAE